MPTSLKQLNEMHDLYKEKMNEDDTPPAFWKYIACRLLNYYLFVIAEQIFILNQKTPDRT